MSTKARDRVMETTLTTGTGSVTLAGAVTGYQAFASALSVGDSHDCCIAAGSEWEISRCTLIGTNLLQRTSPPKSSSNSNAAVSFSVGAKDVFLMPSAINGVTNETLEQMAANTVKANITGSIATPTDATRAAFFAWLFGALPTSGAPAANGDFMLIAASNVLLTFKYKGSDGTVRSVDMPIR